jgi:hypothetical protein
MKNEDDVSVFLKFETEDYVVKFRHIIQYQTAFINLKTQNLGLAA